MDMRPVVRYGDWTTHGGQVLSASSRIIVFGRGVARVGDKIFCPLCKRITEIVQGDASWTVDGICIAVDGCYTSCGAQVLSSCPQVNGDLYSSGNRMMPITGNETAGILKRYANAATGGAAFPEHLTAAEEKGLGSKIRDIYGGNDTIQNQADIEAYNNKDSALGIKHGQIFNASETAVGVLGVAEGGLALSKMGGGSAGPALQSFTGKYKGAPVTLENIEVRNINYERRDRESWMDLRDTFKTKTRKAFLKEIGSNPDNIAEMKAAGLSDGEIERIASGKVPAGYQVHHKIPLDDGGTNDFENLVLIKDSPEHVVITNYQLETTAKIPYGESKNVDFPVPPGIVYPR